MARKSRASSKSKAASSGGRIRGELRKLGKRIDALAVKARKAEARARVGYARQIKALKVKQAAAKRALAHFGRQSAAASGPMKEGLRKAWKDLESAVRQATKRFRETS